MKLCRKHCAIILALVIAITVLPFCRLTAEAATKAPKITAKASLLMHGTKTLKIQKNGYKITKVVSVKSSNQKITRATASKKAVTVYGIKNGTAKITVKVKARKGKKTKKYNLTTTVKVKAPAFKLSKKSIQVGKNAKITKSNLIKKASVRYTASGSCVTVTKNGKITGKAVGSSKIKAKVTFPKTKYAKKKSVTYTVGTVKVTKKPVPEPQPPVLSKKQMTAHIYAKDKTTKLTVYKRADLPNTVWINVMDFLKYDYDAKVQFSIARSGAVYTIHKKGDGASMVIDTAKDTVTFDKLEKFIYGEDAYKSSASAVTNPYVQQSTPEYIPGESIREAVFDLAAYHLDAIGDGNDVYLPITTITDIFGLNYNSAEYVGGEIYFVAAGDEVGADKSHPYVDKTPVYNQTKRSPEDIEYAYNELCFVMDNIYGYPEKNQYSESIKTKGFAKTVEADSDLKHIRDDYLLTDDLLQYTRGLSFLDGILYDGGHNNMADLLDMWNLDIYKNTELIKRWNNEDYKEYPGDSDKYNAPKLKKAEKTNAVMMARAMAYGNHPSTVREWDESSYLQTGKKGIFAFDSFNAAVIPQLVECLNHARTSGVEDFYLDLSCNGGGDERVVAYIMSLMGKDSSLYFVNQKTGNKIKATCKTDRNLDGKFDQNDDAITYDFNFKVVTSAHSFSCGNLFPCYAQKAGIPIYGERSGGGTCMVILLNHTNSQRYNLSSQNKFVSKDDWRHQDDGAPLTEEWPTTDADGKPDYSNFYAFLN